MPGKEEEGKETAAFCFFFLKKSLKRRDQIDIKAGANGFFFGALLCTQFRSGNIFGLRPDLCKYASV